VPFKENKNKISTSCAHASTCSHKSRLHLFEPCRSSLSSVLHSVRVKLMDAFGRPWWEWDLKEISLSSARSIEEATDGQSVLIIGPDFIIRIYHEWVEMSVTLLSRMLTLECDVTLLRVSVNWLWFEKWKCEIWSPDGDGEKDFCPLECNAVRSGREFPTSR